MRIVHVRTGSEVEAIESIAERRIASGQWKLKGEDDGPAESDRKADWVDHAVSQGADRDDADELTKADLIELYG